MNIAEETRIYQAAIEYRRTQVDRDCEEEDDTTIVEHQRRAMEVAWLNHTSA